MFISFSLIVKYPWFLNQLSLNCGIVPGSCQTNDDVTSLMQICHNNNSNNNNYKSKMQINIFWHKANDIDIILHKYQSSSEATHFKCALIER